MLKDGVIAFASMRSTLQTHTCEIKLESACSGHNHGCPKTCEVISMQKHMLAEAGVDTAASFGWTLTPAVTGGGMSIDTCDFNSMP